MNRHFKKYYFYFLARIFDSLGLYEKSVHCYAETIRFRSFFWDSQARYAIAITKNPKKINLQIQGGIGDFLQHLPFILKNKSIDYLGCDIDFLKEYLESKFVDGMTWKNKGFYGWHIDHIVPLSSAKTESMCPSM
jgi:hypothetical protein